MAKNKSKLILKFLLFFFLMLFLNSASYSLTTINVTEGDLVKLKPEAKDPDGDKVFFYYSLPLNESGEWQTGLEDSGMHSTKVIVSDGQNQKEEEVIIYVKNKNQPPKIEAEKLVVEETELIDLKTLVSDSDEDELEFVFQPPFNKEGSWQTTYNDSGRYNTTIAVSDQEFEITGWIEIEIQDKNQLPEITSSFSEEKKVKLKEGLIFRFNVSAVDSDNEPLTYRWLLENETISSEAFFDYYFDYEKAGSYNLTLLISDGRSEISRSWILEIDNVNRAPVIEHPEIIVNEGEKIILQLPERDIDNDFIDYTFQPPFNKEGSWQTTYDDAGNYITLVTGSDGNLTANKEIGIVVKDVDRAPVIKLEKGMAIDEQEKFELDLNSFVSDPDGDELELKVKNIPSGADFTEGKIEWQPGYDFVQRKSSFLTDWLNKLRVEKYVFPDYKKADLIIVACGKRLCANHSLEVKVKNVNRAPVLEEMPEVIIEEAGTAVIKPRATDSDKDYVTYKFEGPFDSNGEWKPTYNEAGELTVKVTASDGYLTDTKEVKINVLNKNRPPVFEIKKSYFKLNENDSFSLKIIAKDPDGDNLTITAGNLTSGASFKEQIFSWTPDFETVEKANKEKETTFFEGFYAKSSFLNRESSKEAESFVFDFTASDGEFEVVYPITITVKNLNRRPMIDDYFPAEALTAEMNKPITFYAKTSDMDGDNLTYEWSFGLWDATKEGADKLKRTFKTPGEKTVKVKVSDGTYSTEKEWKVVVKSPVSAKPKTVPVALAKTKSPKPVVPSQPTAAVSSKPAAALPAAPQPAPMQFKSYIIE